MIHAGRIYRLTPIAEAGDLVDKLVDRSWTLCSAFALGKLIFANDAFSEDGAQEYAVIRDGRQIESIAFSWVEDRDRTRDYVTSLLEGAPGVDMGPVGLRIDHPEGSNSCPLCA